MILARLKLVCILSAACAVAAADPQTFVVDSIACDTSVSFPFLLQADRDAAPEWAVLDGQDLTVSETLPGPPDRRLRLPDGTAKFDIRDAGLDGAPDLAVIRGATLDYWPDAFAASTSEPALRIHDERFRAVAYGSPRPARLFYQHRGEVLLSAPFLEEPRIWNLSGAPVPVAADEQPPSPELIFAQTWDASTSPAAPKGAREYRITQRFEIVSGLADAATADPPRAAAGRAREAAGAPLAEWPWFALTHDTASPDRIAYALAPPEFRDTLIVNIPAALDAPRPNSPRRIPGTLILPGDRAPDVNGDGFSDLVLWRPVRPAPTLDALSDAARTGQLEVVVTVHLFDSKTGRHTGRPNVWFRTMAPFMDALGAGIAGPFAHARFEDIDADGRDELLTSGTSGEVLAWTFTDAPQPRPAYRLDLREPVVKFTYSAQVPASNWLLIVETPSAFQLLTLPQD